MACFMDYLTDGWTCHTNKWAMVRYSVGVAKHHKVTATRRSTDNDFLTTVSLLDNNLLPIYKKVSLHIWRFSTHSCCVNVCNTMLFHQTLMSPGVLFVRKICIRNSTGLVLCHYTISGSGSTKSEPISSYCVFEDLNMYYRLVHVLDSNKPSKHPCFRMFHHR